MILDEIAAKTRLRVEANKREKTLEAVKQQAQALPVSEVFPFEAALARQGLSFICEVKKASPSKGVIAEDFPYLHIARQYELAGAAAISVLTEPDYFLGSDEYLREIAAAVPVPVLRKDFVVDAYQIYEAKLLGAAAVLLICALLPTETLRQYIGITHSLGLSALVEAHDEAEVKSALAAGARVVGVNNRNLKTFQVDTANAEALRGLVPQGVLYVSESGVQGPEDVQAARDMGADAVLVGEALMRAQDKREALRWLRGNEP